MKQNGTIDTYPNIQSSNSPNRITASSGVIPQYYDTSVINKVAAHEGQACKSFQMLTSMFLEPVKVLIG